MIGEISIAACAMCDLRTVCRRGPKLVPYLCRRCRQDVFAELQRMVAEDVSTEHARDAKIAIAAAENALTQLFALSGRKMGEDAARRHDPGKPADNHDDNDQRHDRLRDLKNIRIDSDPKPAQKPPD